MELICGDDPAAWARVGFALDGSLVRVGGVDVRCDGRGGGLRGWELGTRGEGPPAVHPNGAVSLDHVVLFTDDRDASVAQLVAEGGEERRRAGPPDVPVAMAFVRLDGVIVEVAEAGGPPRLWGLVAVVEDLDACVSALGELVGAPKPAVQPGRRIATVRPEAGLETALAFMSPRVAGGAGGP